MLHHFEGVRGAGKSIVTKHDPELSGRKNATNALEKFSMNMDTGRLFECNNGFYMLNDL